MTEPKIVVGMPLYRSVSATWMTHWLTMDLRNVKATMTVEGVYLTHAMTKLVDMALEKGDPTWDRLVIFESDIIPGPDAFNRVAQYSPERHIVGSVCFQHVPPYISMVFGPDPDRPDHPYGVKPFGPDIMKHIVEQPALYECSAVSLGFTAIHRDVLEKWDPDVPMFVHDNEVSHDVYFCQEAIKQGFGVYVDSAMTVDHLSEMPIAYPHNQAFAEVTEGANYASTPKSWRLEDKLPDFPTVVHHEQLWHEIEHEEEYASERR